MLPLLWTLVGLLALSADPIVPRLMNEGDVAGLSIAILRDGHISSIKAYGVRNMKSGTLVESTPSSKPLR